MNSECEGGDACVWFTMRIPESVLFGVQIEKTRVSSPVVKFKVLFNYGLVLYIF